MQLEHQALLISRHILTDGRLSVVFGRWMVSNLAGVCQVSSEMERAAQFRSPRLRTAGRFGPAVSMNTVDLISLFYCTGHQNPLEVCGVCACQRVKAG